MRLAIAILVTLLAAPGVLAQGTGPLTGYEAELMADVWSEIRRAERFEDIDWHSHDLNRAPASPEAQQFFALHWKELRREERFSDIEWDKYRDDESGRKSRAERHAEAERNHSPFSVEEAAAISRVWGPIREAGRFEDVDWRAIGFRGEPGDRDARRIMSQHWGQLRTAERFEDIDWQATAGYQAR